jgi:photosystem II stability/assembly factor-like uncharacterized protein
MEEKMRTDMKRLILVSLLLSTTLLTAGSAYAAPLYFPHIATSIPWQTEIAIINTSPDQGITGTLRAFSDEGQLVETKTVTLTDRDRRQITVADEFTNHTNIGYIIYDTDSDTVQGYTKLYREGYYRAAIPAVKEVNTSDIYIPHIASDAQWWTGISLVNTTSATKDLTIAFNNGQSRQITLNANEHKAFDIAQEFFNNQPQPDIQSAVITNAAGVIGLELFGSLGWGTQLDGLLLTDKTASTIFYPHVAGNEWWTGIVAYNPSNLACTITITPYDTLGTALAPSTLPIAGKGKYIGLVSELGLPAQTAWFRIDSTRPLSGFELFGTIDGNKLAAYAEGGGTGALAGVFPKIEKNGWTGIAFVNMEEIAASLTLSAYNDNGTPVATRTLTVGGHAKVVNLADAIFSQDISGATYMAYSSDREIVGFQLNGSSDGTMLDGLPALAGVGPPAPVWQHTAGPEGGDVRTLAIDPADSRTVYAGTSGGGVFKTINGGASWTAINNGITVTEVYSLAVDPANSQVVYAGTYDGFTGSDGGLFKTTDGGASWMAINTGLTNRFVLTLAVDPENSQIVYAGTLTRGVFKTTDGGASWTAINNGLTEDPWVRSLAIDPVNSQTIYAGSYGLGAFKTTNGGVSWTAINNGLKDTHVNSIAIDPVNSQVVYVGTYSGDSSGGGSGGSVGLNGGIFKTIDGGASWTAINTGITCTSLAINPANSQIVYAGTNGGVMKTTDGGASWTAINAGLTNSNVYSLAIDPENGQAVYAGTYHGGVFKTTNSGASWTAINTGITNSYVLSLAIDPVNSRIVYAGTEGCGVFKTTNGGASWTAINTGITSSYVRSLAIDPANSQTVYAGTYWVYGIGGGFFKTTNGGASWTAIDTGLTNKFIHSLAIDPANSQTVYVGTDGGGVFKTTDGGTSWTAINTGLTNKFIHSLAIDPANSQVIYAGTNSGGIFKTIDGGASWTAIKTGTDSYIGCLAIDPANSQVVYAGAAYPPEATNGSGGVFKTTDGGASWTAINAGFTNTGLTNNNVKSIAIDPSDSRIVYAGTWSGGVFKTTNGGASWRAINTDLTNTRVLSLAIDPSNSRIVYAGTNGAGVFKTME